MTNAEDIYKLFAQFSPRMEFSDSQTGFYGGLRETFERLAVEERTACQWDNLEYIDYPTFGSSNDDFENIVRPFYQAWTGFMTRKSFAWKDVYRYSEAPDRRVRRIMEKENRRLRDEGIREFNDAVRSLVAFAKKRDPRYKANAQTEAQRQETLRQASAAQAARSRAANKANLREHVVPEWAKSEELEEEEDGSEMESEAELERFECVACHKSFKNPKQLEAHERSKKHIKAVKQLRREMEMENKDFGLDADEDDTGNDIGGDDDQETFVATDEPNTNKTGLETVGDLRETLPTDEPETSTEHGQTDPDATSDNEPQTEPPENTIDEDSDADYASRESIERRLHSDFGTNRRGSESSSQHPPTSHLDEPSPKVGKAKQKRNKKAAKMTTQPSSDLSCVVCKASFSSRTQLFRHIRDLDHAQAPSEIRSKGKRR